MKAISRALWTACRLAVLGVLVVPAAMLLQGCSMLERDTLSQDAKATLVGLTQRYLATIVEGDETKLADYIAWADYLGNGDKRISHFEYSRQLQRLNEKYTAENPKHPLVGLRLVSVKGHEDVAMVTLEKADGSAKEQVWIKFVWTGSGWIVLEDSLFGKEKLFARMFPEQQNGNAAKAPILLK